MTMNIIDAAREAVRNQHVAIVQKYVRDAISEFRLMCELSAEWDGHPVSETTSLVEETANRIEGLPDDEGVQLYFAHTTGVTAPVLHAAADVWFIAAGNAANDGEHLVVEVCIDLALQTHNHCDDHCEKYEALRHALCDEPLD